jgi:hypothetical protein
MEYEYTAFPLGRPHHCPVGAAFSQKWRSVPAEAYRIYSGYVTEKFGDRWEVTYVYGGADPYVLKAEARRPQDPNLGVRRWEYKIFPEAQVAPDSWHGHISSCGWTRIGGDLELFKRPEAWIGTDDGDILYQLEVAGLRVSASYGMGSIMLPWGGTTSTPQVIGDVLTRKWLSSEKMGHRMETYEAVQQWLLEQRGTGASTQQPPALQPVVGGC